MLTLSPADVVQQCRDYLRSTQNEDGGWGYAQGIPSQPEPTAMSLLTLGNLSQNSKSVRKACRFLAGLQESSGAIRVPGAFAKS